MIKAIGFAAGAVMLQSVGAAQAGDFSQEITAREVFNQLRDAPSRPLKKSLASGIVM